MNKLVRLTTKEKDILNLLLKGYTNKEIGERLFISVHTVKSHLETVYKKFNIHNRVQLALRYCRYIHHCNNHK